MNKELSDSERSNNGVVAPTVSSNNGQHQDVDISAFKRDIEKNKAALIGDLLIDEINDSSKIEDIVPVITIRKSIFAVKGDIAIVGGLPKVGKTSVCAYMIATAFMKEIPEGMDTLGIRTAYCEGKEMIYVDTEQPKAYTDRLRKSVKRLLGLKDSDPQPKNLKIINLRSYDSPTKLAKVLKLMDHFPNAHLWIIDGVADLIRDPNDIKESFGVIEMLMMKSDEMNSAIVLHIHENPGTAGKLRGNLGSEAERKCGGAITIKKIKEKGIHSIEPKLIRGSEDFEPVLCRFSKELGRLVSLGDEEEQEMKKQIDKDQIKLDKRIELARKATNDGTESLKYTSLVDRIVFFSKTVEGKSIEKRTAQGRVGEMCAMEILVQNGELYELADKYIPQP